MANKLAKRAKQENYSGIKWIFFSAALITIFINPKLSDPFNAPKLYLLMLGSVVLAGYLFFGKNNLTSYKTALTPLVLIFILIMCVQAILTDIKYTAIFGDSQRQLGLITYLGFAIYMLATFKFFRYESKKYLHIIMFSLGLFSTIYGLLQYTGKDPYNWINQYNPIILTLGNPNFSAGFMAIVTTFCFSFIFDKDLSSKIRVSFMLIFGTLMIAIFLSDARQGLVSVLVGVSFNLTVRIYKKNRKLGLLSITGVFVGVIFALAGILQFGPLEKFLYKPSVTLRGYYWRSGLEMFQNNFFKGVGIDRYGPSFKQYASQDFSLNTSYDLMTTNAHNVVIQMFATGGFFLGVSYLSLTLVILYYAFTGFKNLQGNRLDLLNGIFSAWVVFQLQSIVSIDNIGLTIWGWILGGAIVAISIAGDSNNTINATKKIITSSQKNNNLNIQPIFTGTLLIFTLILVGKLTQAESIMFQNKTNLNQNIDAKLKLDLQSNLSFIIDDPFAQPIYKLEAADAFYILGISNLAISGAQKLVENDPINPIYLGVLATMQESYGNFSEAIKLRNVLSKYDPYNLKNYLSLVKLYKQNGDISGAVKVKDKLISLVPKNKYPEEEPVELVPNYSAYSDEYNYILLAKIETQ